MSAADRKAAQRDGYKAEGRVHLAESDQWVFREDRGRVERYLAKLIVSGRRLRAKKEG